MLRDYQQKAVSEIREAWQQGAKNVLVQLATGAGKTVIFTHMMAEEPGVSLAIAHRMELVSQISLTLAKRGVKHDLIAQPSVIREIVSLHVIETGRSYYQAGARAIVAGVDTLLRRPQSMGRRNIDLIVQDEGHHPLQANKWGKVAAMFPNARGLYPTATPQRADGMGLGRHADGIMQALVVGVPMRDLIRQGYLSDYRIFAPPGDLDLSEVPVSASGDYSPPKLRNAVHKSHITGDVVSHYLRIAPGKQGVTFAVDIEAAGEIAAEFRAHRVAAEVITGKTPDLLRHKIMRDFRERRILQLVNVDLLGEGVDVPAIEVVSMARPTNSFAVYSQQFGRALRPMPGKSHAIIIDHAGNVVRHGLPDSPRAWTLDRRDRRARGVADDAIPLRVCLNPECMAVFPRTRKGCPECGFIPVPAARSTPHQVDGDLLELDPEVLARLRGEIDRIDGAPRVPQGLPPHAQIAVANRHKDRQHAQSILRETMAQWAGILHAAGAEDSEIYRTFFHLFGVDIATAQTLNVKDAEELGSRILKKFLP